MKRNLRSNLGGEIAGGNIDITDPKEFVIWLQTLHKLGFTEGEIAEIMARNDVNQWIRDLREEGRQPTETEIADYFKDLKEFHLELEKGAKGSEEES